MLQILQTRIELISWDEKDESRKEETKEENQSETFDLSTKYSGYSYSQLASSLLREINPNLDWDYF